MKKNPDKKFTENCLRVAREVMRIECEELSAVSERLDDSFAQAVATCLQALKNGGKILLLGVGKSGDVARKLASTLTGTGAPAIAVNVGNALHGDLGIVSSQDVAVFISYSGETDELLVVLPHVKRFADKLIAITGKKDASITRACDIWLDAGVKREACPLNLAPTSSAIAALGMGDALAMALLEMRGFKADDFAELHPSGSLGRRLLTKVREIMRPLAECALCLPTASVDEAVKEMALKRCGVCVVIESPKQPRMLGVFSQGDFVRFWQKGEDLKKRSLADLMTHEPVSVREDELAAGLLRLLERHKVDDVIVVNKAGEVVGVVDTQDLSRQRIL